MGTGNELSDNDGLLAEHAVLDCCAQGDGVTFARRCLRLQAEACGCSFSDALLMWR